MRILILCYEFPPLGGGGARVVAALSRQLLLDGHEVDLVTSGGRGLPHRDTIDGVNVHRVRTLRARVDRSNAVELAAYVLAARPTVRRLIRSHVYDVCNCHFIFPDGLLAGIARSSGVRVIVTAHGSDVPGYNPERFRLLHWVLSPLWHHVVNSADGIVCPSPTLARLIGSQSSTAQTIVIPNGFDPARLSPAKERQKRVLVVSRLFKRKGIDRVIKAFSSLATDYELHIVGDGPQLSELRSLAQGASRRIHFRGWLDNSDPQLRELYETSGIFALPSEAENFPVSLLEAMAGGLAIVTSKGTGCADVVGDSALLVPATDTQELGEALKRLIDDEQLRSHLGYSARQRLESHFAWPLVAQRYVDVFSGTEKVAIHG